MPFIMGNPFSDNAINAVQRQQEMQIRRAGSYSRISDTRAPQDDAFKYAQLKASQESDKADRELKRELAQIEVQIKNATTEEEKRRWQAEFDQKQAVLDQKAPGSDAYEREYALDERKVSATEKANRIREFDLFGPGGEDSPSPGSKADLRKAQAAGSQASVEERRARTQEVLRRIEGTLPDQLDARQRTAILGRHQDMLDEAQSVRTAKDMYRLAIDAVRASRDPVTGLLDVEGGQAALSRMFGALQQIAQERGPEFASAFQQAMTDTVQEDQASYAKERGEKASAPYVPPAKRTGGLADTMNVLEEARRRAREAAVGAKPPSTVGR